MPIAIATGHANFGAWLEALGLTSIHGRTFALEFNHTARFAEQIKSIPSRISRYGRAPG